MYDSYAHALDHVRHQDLNPLVVQTFQKQLAKKELTPISPPSTDNTPQAQIHELRITGQLELARDLAISYLQHHSDDVDINLELGLIYFQQKSYSNAEIYLNRVLIKKPNYLDARVALIKTLVAEKKYQNALTVIDNGLKQNKENKQLLELKNNVLSAEQEDIQASQSSIPSIMPTILEEIQQLRKRGQIDTAKVKAMDYLEMHPEDVDVRVQLGLIALQQKNYHLAEDCLSFVLTKAPKYLDARIGLIQTKMGEKKYQEALNLIHEGLNQNPHDAQLKLLAEAVEQAQQHPKATEKMKTEAPFFTAELKKLRQNGKINLAKTKAIAYLKAHPDDVDIMLELGLLYFQQKEFTPAENYLNRVLKKTPAYVDARIGLIHIYLIKNDQKGAMKLLNTGLKITPKNPQLSKLKNQIALNQFKKAKRLSQEELDLLQARTMMVKKNYEQAKQIYSMLLMKNEKNTDARIGLADYYLEKNRDYSALHLIRNGLVNQPNNVKLIIKEGEVQKIFRRYGLAAKAYKKALLIEPQNRDAQAHLDEIKEISPRYTYGINELGLSSDNTYVTHLPKNKIWDYSTAYYARETDIGVLLAKVNYASRFGVNAPQYEVDFSAQLNRNFHADLVAAYSDQPVLFPKYVVGAEGFALVTKSIEISAGNRYSNIGPTYFSRYTGSLNYYPKNYWISFRPYYFVPKDRTKESLLYTGTIRRYFSTIDNFLSLGFGLGHSPDLADLLTVNFIIIKNTYVNLTYEFPIINHHLVVDLGAGYQRWKYQTGLLKELYDGNIGIKYRF